MIFAPFSPGHPCSPLALRMDVNVVAGSQDYRRMKVEMQPNVCPDVIVTTACQPPASSEVLLDLEEPNTFLE